MKPELLRRKDATEKTLQRYRDKSFDWRTGITCVHLARYHLKQMGRTVPAIPRIRSEFAAVRELRARGWKNCAELLDSILPRIVPAAMSMGDLAVAKSGDSIGAIFVSVGSSKLLGWREDAEGMVILDVELDELDGAWRA